MESTPNPAVSLAEAQQIAWMHQHPEPATAREALGRLEETVSQCLDALEGGQIVATQTRLEDSLIQILITMKTLSLDPQQSLNRALDRLQERSAQKVFHVFADHVEIRVQGEKRGNWPLYSQADYDAMLRLARELECDIVHEEANQLELFESAGGNSS